MKSFLIGIKNILLWSYERGSWQYDLLCLLIVGAVFLVPSSYFGDRDRSQPQVANSGSGTAPKGERVEEPVEEEVIESEKLRAFLQEGNKPVQTPDSLEKAIVQYLHNRCQCEVALLRPYEVVSDSNGRVGYRVRFRTK